MSEVQVKLDNGDFITVKKLPIKKYSELFLALQELPKLLGNMQSIDTETIVGNLPQLLSTATPEVIKIVAIASDTETEVIEELGLDEITELITAALEVNNYEKIVANVKKLMARQSQPATKS